MQYQMKIEDGATFTLELLDDARSVKKIEKHLVHTVIVSSIGNTIIYHLQYLHEGSNDKKAFIHIDSNNLLNMEYRKGC